MATRPIDFSDLGGKPVQQASAIVDFSDLGGKKVEESRQETQEEFRSRVKEALPGATDLLVNSIVSSPEKFKNILPADFKPPVGFLKTVGNKLKGMLPPDPTGGHPLLSKEAWLGEGPSFHTPPMIEEAMRPLPEDLDYETLGGKGTPFAKEIGKATYRVAATLAPLAGVSPEESEKASARGDTGAVLGEAAVPLAATLAAPLAGKLAPAAAETVNRVIERTAPFRKVSEFVGKKLPIATAEEIPVAGKLQPALANTPTEVVNYAASKGIDLTPSQATGAMAAKAIEGVGERSLVGGKALEEARTVNAQKLANNIQEFANRIDPKAMGTSEEAAGGNIKQAAETAKEVAHDNASQGYQKIEHLMGERVDPALISQKWISVRGRLPLGAEDQILAQVPRSMRAQVSEMLQPTGMDAPLTFDQGIALRSFFREMGETEGLPNSQQGIFRQLEKATDSAMEKSAENVGAAQDWRAANEGWKDYTSLYGDRQSPLYRILKQQDPAKITRDILNRSSAHDIDILNKEGMSSATDALKRQALTDIANRGFTVRGDGLGGYSHSFLNTLFGPEATKELYLNGDLARRFKFQVNPSGTSNVLLAFDQLRPGEPSKMMVPMGAAKASMPRPAASYLPEGKSSKGPTPSGNLPGGPTSFTPKKGAPNFAYRVRNQGEEGLPIGGSASNQAHASTTLEDAQRLAPGREAVTGEKQEVVRYDLSKLKEGKDYVRVKRAGQSDWIRMLRPLREADLQAVKAQ